MGKTAKVAISLPEDILKVVEKERKARGESRSEFFRQAMNDTCSLNKSENHQQ